MDRTALEIQNQLDFLVYFHGIENGVGDRSNANTEYGTVPMTSITHQIQIVLNYRIDAKIATVPYGIELKLDIGR